jgi:hypothetical protein
MNQVEQRTMKKVFRHLVPFLMLCYFFNFLDRVNVSFAEQGPGRHCHTNGVVPERLVG